jgi:LAO/AO transport system kinase
VEKLRSGSPRQLARAISLVENEVPGYESLLYNITHTKNTPVIGITGPPGAGKSTIVNALISHYTGSGKKSAL